MPVCTYGYICIYIYTYSRERDMYICIYYTIYYIYILYIYYIYICILDELSMYILITRTVKAKHAANKKKNSIGFFQKFAGFHLVNLGSKPWFAVKKFP